MRTLVELLPGLACAGGMAIAMWIVMRPAAHGARRTDGADASGDRLEELERELAELRAEAGDRARTPQS